MMEHHSSHGEISWANIFLLLLVIVGVLPLLSACEDPQEGTSTSPSLPILSVEAYWDFAHEQAYAWHTDAQILEVRVEVALPNSSVSSSNIKFTFVSPEDRLTEWVLSCTPEGCSAIEVDRTPGHPSRLCPFEFDDFKIDSKEALQIALDNGLDEYISHELAFLDLKLGRTIVCMDHVVWSASGLIPSPFHSTDVWIDAMTGEVIESPYRTEP